MVLTSFYGYVARTSPKVINLPAGNHCNCRAIRQLHYLKRLLRETHQCQTPSVSPPSPSPLTEPTQTRILQQPT